MSGENTGVVTENDLTKALSILEGVKPPAETKVDPVVKTAVLEKSAADTVREGASKPLQKAMDVSDVLDEVVALLGTHVDRSLSALAKSVQEGAQRDLGVIRVLEGLKKSIDDNTAAVKALMDQPAASASAHPITVDGKQVLQKSSDGKQHEAPVQRDPNQIRKAVGDGLTKLIKAADGNPSEMARLTKALVKFESAGQISDADVQAALKA